VDANSFEDGGDRIDNVSRIQNMSKWRCIQPAQRWKSTVSRTRESSAAIWLTAGLVLTSAFVAYKKVGSSRNKKTEE
jgi:hypothetical protein